ncbi:membrane dipeptidase [Peribacillus deserti]|uniref:Membrane dipeptidase n=1 Tax=Peribacillus deserti TaxID=673318 RepID=A0ABS2QD36_9BACI|nr:dipeptidase [Peribacillus deserti]MBM7691070.1 membrane dipeptidase [Peribacillus deserti]
MNHFPILDGHNDTLLNLYHSERGLGRSFFIESDAGHIDLPRAERSGFGGGFFAVFTPNSSYKMEAAETGLGYEIPLPPPIDHEYAVRKTHAMAANLFRYEAESSGRFKVVRSSDELSSCIEKQIVAAIFHIEGAEAIDTDLDALHVFYKAGLRSLGIVWSRPNAFGEGVPFKFPSSPDIGGGLTAAGKNLVRECNSLGIMLDTSHLTEKGFWDVANITDKPIVATHSNAHALCPMSRNITDKQIAAIAESGGVVGINFSIGMLRKDGGRDDNTPIHEISRHIEYIAGKFGIDHVAFGSDFDGTNIPAELKDVTGLPKIIQDLREKGFSDSDLLKISHQNWQRVLKNTWK